MTLSMEGCIRDKDSSEEVVLSRGVRSWFATMAVSSSTSTGTTTRTSSISDIRGLFRWYLSVVGPGLSIGPCWGISFRRPSEISSDLRSPGMPPSVKNAQLFVFGCRCRIMLMPTVLILYMLKRRPTESHGIPMLPWISNSSLGRKMPKRGAG